LNTSRLDADTYVSGIRNGDRLILAKAITLIESHLPHDQDLADQVLTAIIPFTGKSVRVGITGSPGVGKSTFIESFGLHIAGQDNDVAVLTVDPSSPVSGGSILGDKTRMETLARHPRVFIRPSPAGDTLGGVTAHTRETILLCEAAGFNYIIVETVGTGQSEFQVKNMVDFFLLLMQPGSGDELQGIKKGIVELADAIAVTKADADPKQAQQTATDFKQALHLAHPKTSGWQPRVLTCSAVQDIGLDNIARLIEEFRETTSATGFFEANRQQQRMAWMIDHFRFLLSIDPNRYEQVTALQTRLRDEVSNNILTPRQAATRLLEVYHAAIRKSR
jgi:LAO/AO transport system kinase